MKEVDLYTDGACSGNPGPGGWGAILIYGKTEKELWGFEETTTNQRMEQKAAIEGLKALRYPCKVKIYSDSAYLINAFRQNWIGNWLANGWKNSQNNPVENQDYWRDLINLNRIHQIEWIKVKGHEDNVYNNRCDQLARAAVKKITEQGHGISEIK